MSVLKSCNVRVSSAKTSFYDGSYVLKWALEKFPKWPEIFETNSYNIKLANGVNVSISISKAENYCSLEVNFTGKTKTEMEVNVSITDTDGNCFCTKSPETYMYDSNERYSSEQRYFLRSSSDLKEFSNSTQDQIIILKITLDYFQIPTEFFVDPPMPSPSDILPAVVQNLKYMYDNSLFTDVKLTVDDGQVINAHKAVLGANSSVFMKMLSSPMDENSKDVIKITDIEFAIMKSFVEFLYSGEVADTSLDSACALYYAADKYNVSNLRKTCSKILLAKLDVHNACRVLSLAERHTDDKLKKSVLEFMKFEFKAIIKTDAWIEFNKSEADLAAKVEAFVLK